MIVTYNPCMGSGQLFFWKLFGNWFDILWTKQVIEKMIKRLILICFDCRLKLVTDYCRTRVAVILSTVCTKEKTTNRLNNWDSTTHGGENQQFSTWFCIWTHVCDKRKWICCFTCLFFLKTHYIHKDIYNNYYTLRGRVNPLDPLLPSDKQRRCFDAGGRAAWVQIRIQPVERRAAPLRVFPQTTCGPAEVTGRTCLLVERLAERERRKEGEPEGEQPLKRNGNPSFFFKNTCFFFFFLLTLFTFVDLIVFHSRGRDADFSQSACVCFYFYFFNSRLVCFGLA